MRPACPARLPLVLLLCISQIFVKLAPSQLGIPAYRLLPSLIDQPHKLSRLFRNPASRAPHQPLQAITGRTRLFLVKGRAKYYI